MAGGSEAGPKNPRHFDDGRGLLHPPQDHARSECGPHPPSGGAMRHRLGPRAWRPPGGRNLQGECQRDEPFLDRDPEPLSLASDPTASPLIDPTGEEPIRAELFGLDGLEALARRVASACTLGRPVAEGGDPLLRRFAENGQVLVKTHREIASEVDRPEGRGIDAEWLVDNFHIVEEVLREIRQDLPRGYDAELPSWPSAGPAIPGSTPWPWPWSPTPTAGWTRRGSAGSSRRSSRSPADDRRTLGGADDAPAGPDREPPPPGRADGPGWDERGKADAWVRQHPAPPGGRAEADRDRRPRRASPRSPT